MQPYFYADKLDLLKWGSIVSIAKHESISYILQVGRYDLSSTIFPRASLSMRMSGSTSEARRTSRGLVKRSDSTSNISKRRSAEAVERGWPILSCSLQRSRASQP